MHSILATFIFLSIATYDISFTMRFLCEMNPLSKVRLQSPAGFWKSGGFHGIYRGLGAVAIGSAPGAALFFSTYETMKPLLQPIQQKYGFHESVSHMIAASMGEMAACLVRVPTEVIKTKMQTAKAHHHHVGLVETVNMVLHERHGSSVMVNVTGGLYRGFGMTLFREIPFAIIQFPLYEKFKSAWATARAGTDGVPVPVNPIQAAACGSFSGAIAGAITTPLDVLKTRTQLGHDKDGIPYNGVRDVLNRTIKAEGTGALWNGIQPRVMWIGIGGFVFFGAYETSKKLVGPILH